MGWSAIRAVSQTLNPIKIPPVPEGWRRSCALILLAEAGKDETVMKGCVLKHGKDHTLLQSEVGILDNRFDRTITLAEVGRH